MEAELETDPTAMEDHNDEAEAAREAVKLQALADEKPKFQVPGSSLVIHKRLKTIHLAKEEGDEGEEWLDTAKLFCGRIASTKTHNRVLCADWPLVVSPACTDCFANAQRRSVHTS